MKKPQKVKSSTKGRQNLERTKVQKFQKSQFRLNLHFPRTESLFSLIFFDHVEEPRCLTKKYVCLKINVWGIDYKYFVELGWFLGGSGSPELVLRLFVRKVLRV